LGLFDLRLAGQYQDNIGQMSIHAAGYLDEKELAEYDFRNASNG
jgi:hypothetical protein